MLYSKKDKDEKTDDGQGYTYTYDKENRLTSVTGPDGVMEATYTYDRWGNCVQMTDENGCDTYYTYDFAGRLIRKLEPVGDINDENGSINYRMTTYVYDNNGNRTKEIRHSGTYTQDGSLQDPGDDLVLTFTYDARNRLVCVEDGQGARVSYRYDERGKLTQKRELLDDGLKEDVKKEPETAVTGYSYDENGNLTGIITPEGYCITREYDCRDRMIMEQTEDKANGIVLKTLYTYDCAGNITSVRQEAKDGGNREISYDYDLKDRMTSIQERDGRNAFLLYDKNDRRIRKKHLLPKEKEDYSQTMLCYDIRGRLMEKYRNEISIERNIYNVKGSLLNTRDGDGVEISCRYGIQDEQRQVFTVNSRRQGRAAQTLSYNTRGMITKTEDGCGSMTKAVAGGSSYTYEYTPDGRLINKYSSGKKVQSCTYYRSGSLKSMTDANGKTLFYEYNNEGRLKTLKDDSNEILTAYRYTMGGRIKEITTKGGIRTTYGYDEDGNISRLTKESYHSDSVDEAESYQYNERNELTKRTVAGDTASITLYHYDNNGSIISEEQNGRTSEYRYDLLNRQTYVRTLNGKEQENFYDGEGLRAGLTENGKKTIFLYNNGEILTECDGESAPVRRYLNGIGLSHVQTLEDGLYHAYHQDEQGSTAYITEEQAGAKQLPV